MASIGMLLVVLGLGSLVLPLLNMQFTFMSVLDAYQPFAGIVVAAIGAVLIAVATQRRQVTVTHTDATAPTAPEG